MEPPGPFLRPRVMKLEVASPCSVSWDSMEGSDAVRYCGSCQLSVYNFSELDEHELADLIQRREGNVCGRFWKRVDGTVITKDCPVGRLQKLRRRLMVVGGVLIAAVVTARLIDQSQLRCTEWFETVLEACDPDPEQRVTMGKPKRLPGPSIPH